MADVADPSLHSSSENVGAMKEIEKMEENLLAQGIPIESGGDSNSDFEANEKIQDNDLASEESKKPSPVATPKEKVSEVSSPISPSNLTEEQKKKIEIDTKKPFDSVKTAVSKFGGIVDWKSPKVNNTVEKTQFIDQEFDKIQEEIPIHKEKVEIAEHFQQQMLRDLQSMNTVIEELKLNLESAQTEEHEAKQDCQFAQQRVEEIELEISQEAEASAKTELEAANARYTAAITDLKAVKDELECLRKEYDETLAEKNEVDKKTEEVISSSNEMEHTAEKLAAELISLKEKLEYENDLKKVEKDVEKLEEEIESANDLKSELDKASSLLNELKDELVKAKESSDTYRELEEVKLSIEKATNEVSFLREETASLKEEVEKEQSELANVTERQGELEKIMSETDVKLADEEELKKAEEEAEETKALVNTIEKEIEEAKATQKLAHDVTKVVEEDTDDGVTLSLDEYDEISKHAKEAEDQANINLNDALSKLDVEKESESRSLKELEDVSDEVEDRKKSLRLAQENAKKAKEVKLAVEHELKKSKAGIEERKKSAKKLSPTMGQCSSLPLASYGQGVHLQTVDHIACFTEPNEFSTSKSEGWASLANDPNPNGDDINPNGPFSQSNTVKKKKKSAIPRFFMFFTRRRSKHS